MNLYDYALADQSLVWTHVPEGLRLQKLEVYNWGTFDKQIWTFTPHGETSLLTGDSGTGKSTLVDALITLFVSPRKITYNKAADASAKERSLTSYVRGYYGQKYAYEGKGKPEALRNTNQYSVLLATIADVEAGKTVTIAALFWFREQQATPSRLYVVAKREMSIAQEFSGFQGDAKKLRAMLRSDGCEVFDDYNHYAECYQKALGNLTQQAIDLFQQTISMKKVEALTDFVRSNMLEETNVADDINKLLQHYLSLDRAYEAVQRARKQIELLQPVCTKGIQHSLCQANLIEIERGQQALEYWYAAQKRELYVERIAQLIQAVAAAKYEKENEQRRMDDIDSQIKQLEKEIDKNGGGAFENLQKELQRKKELLERRKKDLGRYSEHAQRLSLAHPATNAIFIENQKRAELLLKQLPEQIEIADKSYSEVTAKLEQKKAEQQEIKDEIESLRKRTSNIPKELISLRERLCAELSISASQLPFAGELLEVKESEAEWEGAIERLLYSFALSLLVSDEHYDSVARWVNEKNLKAKLVYFAVRPQQGEISPLQVNSVANKLEVKQETVFTKWLIRETSHRFSHICCDNMTAFRSEKRAITKMGQIKSATRHEKDDRRKLIDPTRYVLGFSNQKKIKALVDISDQLAETICQMTQEKEKASNEKVAITLQESALSALENFKEFSEIDIKSVESEIEACLQRIDALTNTENDVLSVLRAQLNEAIAKKELQSGTLEQARKEHVAAEIALENMLIKQKENKARLETETPSEKGAYAWLAENKASSVGNAALTLDNAASQEKRHSKALEVEHNKVKDEAAQLQTDIVKGIVLFRNAFPNEAKETDDTVQSLPDYHRMLERLHKDDLPKYESDFKELLTSRVIQQIAVFHATLKQQYKIVKDRISDINRSLGNIDYNPKRYIQLNCEDNSDAEIKNFRVQLKACTEGALGGFENEEMVASRFLQIKEILERFQGREKETESDKRWTKKVTDVRNWFVFSASERWRDSDEEYEHYTDSGGKSGGQKEKLAYTILAASLVYNYGMHQDYVDQSSFRLVIIDEAFLKSSDDSAKFGLELFRQLNFQLIIVTPLLKITTVEPFIAHVGFVSHDDVVHRSSVSNISIEVYQKKRKAWEEQRFDSLV